MNVQCNIHELVSVLPPKVALMQVASAIKPIAAKADLLFPTPQVGPTYQQWALPGSGWVSFTELPDDLKPAAAAEYVNRRNIMQAALKDSPVGAAVLTVPSDEYIYFRQQANRWEIAVAAWGFKSHNILKKGEIDTWIKKTAVQDVNVGFSWDHKLLPNFPFMIDGYSPQMHGRVTGPDGLLHFDRPLPVGEQHNLLTHDGKAFSFVVEAGKADYVFDLTEHFNVEVEVINGAPTADIACDINFYGTTVKTVTDATGHARATMPLISTPDGNVALPQPECIVTVDSRTQRKTPVMAGETLRFVFDFTAPPEPDKITAQVTVEVVKDGGAVSGQECKLSFNGADYAVVTDHAGKASIDLVLENDPDGHVLQSQPAVTAECAGKADTKVPTADGAPVAFRFDLTEDKPKFVTIVLKDYGGKPLPDMPFTLELKSKGKLELKTDENGSYTLPAEWFTPKEKMNVKFVVTPEYQKTHDIYLKEKEKKQN